MDMMHEIVIAIILGDIMERKITLVIRTREFLQRIKFRILKIDYRPKSSGGIQCGLHHLKYIRVILKS